MSGSEEKKSIIDVDNDNDGRRKGQSLNMLVGFTTSQWIIISICILLIVLSSTISITLSKNLRNRKLRHRFAHGRDAEEKAVKYFQKLGYRITGQQVEADSCFYADGKMRHFKVRADMTAEKGGKQSLIEVKTGSDANPGCATTRRQIFEYSTIYEADNFILFDADNDRHYSISFDRMVARSPKRISKGWLGTAVAAGLFLGFLSGRFL